MEVTREQQLQPGSQLGRWQSLESGHGNDAATISSTPISGRRCSGTCSSIGAWLGQRIATTQVSEQSQLEFDETLAVWTWALRYVGWLVDHAFLQEAQQRDDSVQTPKIAQVSTAGIGIHGGFDRTKPRAIVDKMTSGTRPGHC